MTVDGQLVAVAYNVDDCGVRPYVCMDYEESVTLLNAKSYIRSTVGPMSEDKDWEQHLYSSIWTEPIDRLILDVLHCGKHRTNEFITVDIRY